jgi:hypothetical protein
MDFGGGLALVGIVAVGCMPTGGGGKVYGYKIQYFNAI